jgi:hypothetical protein
MLRSFSITKSLAPRFNLFLLLLALMSVTALTPVSAADSIAVADLKGYSTIQSIGVELQINGDDNHNAVCTLRYRPTGAGEWKSALNLFRVDYTPP